MKRLVRDFFFLCYEQFLKKYLPKEINEDAICKAYKDILANDPEMQQIEVCKKITVIYPVQSYIELTEMSPNGKYQILPLDNPNKDLCASNANFSLFQDLFFDKVERLDNETQNHYWSRPAPRFRLRQIGLQDNAEILPFYQKYHYYPNIKFTFCFLHTNTCKVSPNKSFTSKTKNWMMLYQCKPKKKPQEVFESCIEDIEIDVFSNLEYYCKDCKGHWEEQDKEFDSNFFIQINKNTLKEGNFKEFKELHHEDKKFFLRGFLHHNGSAKTGHCIYVKIVKSP